MALFRALETRRSTDDRIFSDPYAKSILNPGFRIAVKASVILVIGRLIGRIIQNKIPGAFSSGLARTQYMLAGIGTNKNYCSLYVMSPSVVKELKGELKGVKVSGATLHFPPGEPLPAPLIQKIILARVKEIEIKARAKK